MNANRSGSILLGLACVAGLATVAAPASSQPSSTPSRAEQGEPAHVVVSQDGTRIAYDKRGSGPAVIVVGGALSDRTGAAELAGLLAAQLTVYSYDRRGRGGSPDIRPYSVAREVEDLDALIDEAGGSAFVYGKSSGASLALQAAAALGDKVTKLALYEAPYSDAEGAAAEWRTFTANLDALLAADRRADAIAAFMKFVGAPDEAVAKMKASPAWPAMLAMAPSLAHDNDVVGDDRSVPGAVAAGVKARTLVLDGSASLEPMPYMRATADKLAGAIPHAERRTVEGQAHDVSAQALAPILLQFFGKEGNAR